MCECKEEKCCARCAHNKGQYKQCMKQPLGVVNLDTECCTKFEEKCCGNCCWFYGEMTDGEGFCALRDPLINETRCDFLCSDEVFVSRQQMRHYMAVLLQWERYNKSLRHSLIVKVPATSDMNNAMKFAYKYMKIFSKL